MTSTATAAVVAALLAAVGIGVGVGGHGALAARGPAGSVEMVAAFARCSPNHQLVTHVARNNVWLMRGRAPSALGQIAFYDDEQHDQLLRELVEVARCMGVPVQLGASGEGGAARAMRDIYLVDIDVEYDATHAELRYFDQHPERGQYLLWPMQGERRKYDAHAPDTPDNRYHTEWLPVWSADMLAQRTAQLHRLLTTAPRSDGRPVFVYVHCADGHGRTGELMGAYYMRYLGVGWWETNAINTLIARHPIHCDNYQALQWMCAWLRHTKRQPAPAVDVSGVNAELLDCERDLRCRRTACRRCVPVPGQRPYDGSAAEPVELLVGTAFPQALADALPSVAVVITEYSAAHAAEMLGGVFAQTYPNMALVVVDDRPCRNRDVATRCLDSQHFVDGLHDAGLQPGAHLHKIRYTCVSPSQHGGGCPSHVDKQRAGLAGTHEEYVTFWEPGDYYPLTRIAMQMQEMLKSGAAVSVLTRRYVIDTTGETEVVLYEMKPRDAGHVRTSAIMPLSAPVFVGADELPANTSFASVDTVPWVSVIDSDASDKRRASVTDQSAVKLSNFAKEWWQVHRFELISKLVTEVTDQIVTQQDDDAGGGGGGGGDPNLQ